MSARIACLLGAFFVIPYLAVAQEIPQSIGVVDTVDVIAPRPFPEERLSGLHGFVQVLPIDRSTPVSEDLGDLLQQAAGVRIRRLGGLGAMVLGSIRGSSPSHLQITIDETPISTADDAQANLSLLSPRLFERIEITRGPAPSVGFGSSAGAVRMVPSERFGGDPQFRIGIGSFGTTTLSGNLAGQIGRFSYSAAAGRLTSEGDYTYRDRLGTPLEPGDDRWVRRKNNRLRQEDFLVQTRWSPVSSVQIRTLSHGLWRKAGIPGTENLQTEHVRHRLRRWIQGLTIESGGTEAMTWKLSAHLQRDVDRYRNPDGEVGLVPADQKSRLLAGGSRLVLSLPLPRLQGSVRLAGALRSENWKPEDLLHSTPSNARTRGTTTLMLGFQTRRLGDRLLLHADQQWVRTSERLAGDSESTRLLWSQIPRGGFTLDPGGGLQIRGSVGRLLRLPSFLELFGRGAVQAANPDLVPETGFSWDLGGNMLIPRSVSNATRLRARLELAYFETHTDQAIVWLQNSQWTTRAENLEETRVRGAEAILRLARSSYGMTVAYTYQIARNIGPSATYHGNDLPHQPHRQLSFENRLGFGGVTVIHQVDYESSIYRDLYNSASKRRGSRLLQHLELRMRPGEGRLETSIGIRNLTDQQTSDLYAFPLPGRSLSLKIGFVGSREGRGE